MYMKHDDLYNKIIESYSKTNSVKKTAEKLGTSVIKVRRVLITEGLWSSATSRKILELHEQGLSTQEIAEKLHYTDKNVQAFLPYSRGVYGQEKQSMNSLKSKEYRERNQQAAQRQVGYGFDSPRNHLRNEIIGEGNGSKLKELPIALNLHLELNMDDCDEHDKDVLHRYGKMKNAIVRDVIVPADITLHSLHYAIQKLFGWQNAHLHHYAFPEDVFEKVTENSFAKWCRLAGVYFRFPSDEMDDLFWDDNYSADTSIKSWLKSKYKGPYQYGGLGDYYFENQKNVMEFKNGLPSFEVRESFEEFMRNGGRTNRKERKVVSTEEAAIEELRNSIDLGGDLNCLLERLSLLEFIYLPDKDYPADSLEDRIAFLEENLNSDIKSWNSILDDIDNNFVLFCKYVDQSTIRMQAQSHQINYFYDYGDRWEVSITLTKAYYQDDIQNFEDINLQKVIATHSPACVESDGLPVFDDVGGIHGFIDFLSALHSGENEEDKQERLEWARSFGWTGRESKPQNIL